MDQLTHHVRRTNWQRIITECLQRPAGVMAKQWEAEMQRRSKHPWPTKVSVGFDVYCKSV